MFVNRTRGVLWATSGVLALVGCTDPAQKTDLRPAGPPEVLSVLVMNDAAGNLAEGATFCKTGDPFRPGLVSTIDGVGHQLCPDDVSMGVDELADANPSNWYVRVMFDELLDPSIEDLVPILDDTGMDTGTESGTLANTQPFTLQCQSVDPTKGLVDVPYDGYYSPAGNKITWPVGPSLVVVPSSPSLVATQSECQITLKDNIKDKDGNAVPMDQRGPYKFKIAPVQVIAADTSPADGDMVDPIAAGVDLTFNTAVDPSTIGVTFTPDPGNDFAQAESDTEFFFGADFEANASYMWALTPGSMIADQCGKLTTVGTTSVDTGDAGSFTTNDIAFTGIAPFDTQMNAKASSKIALKFNQFMDPTTLAASEYTLTPAVQGVTTSYDAGLNLIIDGEYKPDTDYTFTLKSGATIDDCPGGEFAFGGCGPKSAMGGTFTNTADQTVHFHTAPLTLTSVSPADLATVTLGASGKIKIDLTFNQDMDPTTLATTEYSISPAITFAAPVNPATGLAVPATSRNVVELVSSAAVAPGDYTFTLKMGATINDKLTTPDTYTQAADKVIHFTVAAAPTSTPPSCY
jgi:hypothetical protein